MEPTGENPQAKPQDAKLFYSVYSDFADALRAQVRQEAFGEDIGQFGWLTADEYRDFFRRLDLREKDHVLDVACGSGGPALFMARTTGCRVTGVDINEAGIQTATATARERGQEASVDFRKVDAREQLRFDEAAFDAVVCIDAINHFYNRLDVLRDWNRVLKPGGRILFTDPIVVAGMITRDEMITRSGAMGLFVFTPLNINEGLIEEAGFTAPVVSDATANIAQVSRNWQNARSAREQELRKLEGDQDFDSFQAFLGVVHRLSDEGRLQRLCYLARKA
jgi:2-polyprenyl-3-methyl-5-hydroxy-6-metoxy-1,4-benzoquinol methylase